MKATKKELELIKLYKPSEGVDEGTDIYMSDDEIIDFAKQYHESELKKLRVTDVSRRSEQLIDFAIKNGYIEDMPKGNKMGLIDKFEKSINCR